MEWGWESRHRQLVRRDPTLNNGRASIFIQSVLSFLLFIQGLDFLKMFA